MVVHEKTEFGYNIMKYHPFERPALLSQTGTLEGALQAVEFYKKYLTPLDIKSPLLEQGDL